jgi:hypothetical protein
MPSRSPNSIEVPRWKVLGFELWWSPHPSVGAVTNEGQQTRKGYNTGSLGSLQEFHKITDGSLIWKYERNAGLDGSWRSHVQPLSGYWNHEQTVLWFWQMFFYYWEPVALWPWHMKNGEPVDL